MYQHRQIHVWISESDYLLLQEQSVVTRESVSALLRRYIKNERLRLKSIDKVQSSEFWIQGAVLGAEFCEPGTNEPGTAPGTLNPGP
jgi:hypothetical protein